ncbi:TPA: hypothetical protein ACH3X3_007221 [Trebouxia sp. C0006]
MAAETSLLNTGRFVPSISYTPRPANFTRWWRCRGWTCCRQRPCHHTFDQSVQHLRNRPQSTNSPASRNKQYQVAAHATLQGGLVEPRSGGARELLTWISELPWARVAIWATVVVTASQFQDFFGIVMGTFIVAFIGNGFVASAQNSTALKILDSKPMLRRRLLVLLYFSGIVSVVFLFGVMTIPDIVREGADFVRRLKSENVWVVVLEKMRNGLGDGVMDQVERAMLVASGDAASGKLVADSHAWTHDRTLYLGHVLQKMLRGYTDAAVSITSNLVTIISRFAVQVGVSLVLSFMVVWDLPTIARGVQSLRSSRLRAIYMEVAPTFTVFGQLFGKALQAQAQIAMANTALTTLGMWILQIPGIGLLGLFVFICSFIPIAGVFISTVPIAFVALTEYGFVKLGFVIAMVTGIHFVEAYLLNPAIYSANLHLHPLLVISTLVVAEHSLGVWGLLLAVPLTVFLLDYCIRYPAESMTDVAARELESVSVDFGDL